MIQSEECKISEFDSTDGPNGAVFLHLATQFLPNENPETKSSMTQICIFKLKCIVLQRMPMYVM